MVTELDRVMACNQAEWGIEFHSEFDRQMLKSLSNEIIWAKNGKAPLASSTGNRKEKWEGETEAGSYSKRMFFV